MYCSCYCCGLYIPGPPNRGQYSRPASSWGDFPPDFHILPGWHTVDRACIVDACIPRLAIPLADIPRSQNGQQQHPHRYRNALSLHRYAPRNAPSRTCSGGKKSACVFTQRATRRCGTGKGGRRPPRPPTEISKGTVAGREPVR